MGVRTGKTLSTCWRSAPANASNAKDKSTTRAAALPKFHCVQGGAGPRRTRGCTHKNQARWWRGARRSIAVQCARCVGEAARCARARAWGAARAAAAHRRLPWRRRARTPPRKGRWSPPCAAKRRAPAQSSVRCPRRNNLRRLAPLVAARPLQPSIRTPPQRPSSSSSPSPTGLHYTNILVDGPSAKSKPQVVILSCHSSTNWTTAAAGHDHYLGVHIAKPPQATTPPPINPPASKLVNSANSLYAK